MIDFLSTDKIWCLHSMAACDIEKRGELSVGVPWHGEMKWCLVPLPRLPTLAWKLTYDPVCPLVGWMVDRSICHNFLEGGKFPFHAPIGALVDYIVSFLDHIFSLPTRATTTPASRAVCRPRAEGRPEKETLSPTRASSATWAQRRTRRVRRCRAPLPLSPSSRRHSTLLVI